MKPKTLLLLLILGSVTQHPNALSEEVNFLGRPVPPRPETFAITDTPPAKLKQMWIGTWSGIQHHREKDRTAQEFEFYLRVGDKDDEPTLEKYSFKRETRNPDRTWEKYFIVIPGYELKQDSEEGEVRSEITVERTRFSKDMKKLIIEFVLHIPTKGGNTEEKQQKEAFELRRTKDGDIYVVDASAPFVILSKERE